MITDLETDSRRAMCRAVQPEIANTEPKPASTSLAVAKRADASEGPERTGNKPLMRNPSANKGHPDRHTASDTLLDPIAVVVQELATRGRSRISVAYALVDLKLFTDLGEAERAAKRYYP